MSFLTELKRRNVFRVGIAYLIVAWLVMQVADVVINNIEAPIWVFQVIMLVLGIGFPIVLIFAWAFEMTPDGLKKEKDVDRSQSIAPDTSRKLDYTIIFVLVLALGYFVFDEIRDQSSETTAVVAETVAQVETSAIGDETPIDPSIAVLPFTDMSPDQDQGYFSDGISEELLNLLVRVDGLKVASRTSSFTYKGSNQSLAEIAGELKVDHVLEGSVRKAENRIRITAQLIDAKTDRHIWSDTFDRELVDIFAIQDEIANAIVTALSAELGILQNSPAISVATATENLDAYELYLRARSLFLAREKLEESISLYERAVEIDPDFARAWAGLAAVYAVVESWNIHGRDWDSLAIMAAERALEIDSELSTSWAVIGQVTNNKGDYVSGMSNMDHAIKLDPSNATHYLWRGIDYSLLGFQTQSIADLERCLEIDPAYENCRRHLALTYQIIDDEQARTLFQQGAERGFNGSNDQFTQRFVSQGERLLAALILLNPDDNDSTFPTTAILDAMEFPERDHSRGLEKLLDWIEKSEDPTGSYSILLSAFRAYHLVEPHSFQNRWVWLRENTGFRTSEYFKPLMGKLGVPAYWRGHGFPPNCRPLGEEDFECD